MGFVVNDVKAVGQRLREAGYKSSYPFTDHQHRLRDYYLDADGNEYEFIQYLSDKPEDRNSYVD
jgi:predicted lactoylglutathione lyase